jgi:predicted alpha/beta hydrolase family esterase
MPKPLRRSQPKRAFIIHGYQSYPEEAWLPWLKAKLMKRSYRVALPAMPNPGRPSLPRWISFIADLVGEPDGKTVMVGHSLGCQAVLRYLEKLGGAGKSVGRTVLVAGAFPIGMPLAEAKRKAGGNKAMVPWFTTTVDPKKVKAAAGKCTVILSLDDPYIPAQQALADFRANLNPRIVVEQGKGHFNEDDHLTELPAALQAATARDGFRQAGSAARLRPRPRRRRRRP